MYKHLNKLNDQVWVLPNFINESDLLSLQKDIELVNPKNWYKDDSPKDSFWYGRSLHKSSLNENSRSIIRSVEENLNLVFQNYERIHEVQSILKTTDDGRHLGYHKDNTAEGDQNNIFGVVIYLNESYEGGEIHYKDLDFSYKPNQGDLVVHYAGLEHGVTEVTKGVRYILTSFVKGSKETTFLGEPGGS